MWFMRELIDEKERKRERNVFLSQKGNCDDRNGGTDAAQKAKYACMETIPD